MVISLAIVLFSEKNTIFLGSVQTSAKTNIKEAFQLSSISASIQSASSRKLNDTVTNAHSQITDEGRKSIFEIKCDSLNTNFDLYSTEFAPISQTNNIQVPKHTVNGEVLNDHIISIQSSVNDSSNTGIIPSTSTSLVKESEQILRAHSGLSTPKRNERILSVEETMLKHERDLELARKSIKNLQTQLGTVILSEDSDSDTVSSTDEGNEIQAEVEQVDSVFAHEYKFKTNVRTRRNQNIILI